MARPAELETNATSASPEANADTGPVALARTLSALSGPNQPTVIHLNIKPDPTQLAFDAQQDEQGQLIFPVQARSTAPI